MATNEELEQRVKELESLIVAQYDPPSGPEYSFPVPGRPIDQDQFKLMSLMDGNAIIDRGGQPYWLRPHETEAITNQKNSMMLTVSNTTKKAEAIVGGFYHVLNQNKEIELPAVSVETTYWICLTFDPRILEEGDAVGPIKVVRYDSQPPTTFDRVHVVLWKVTRKPNQLLTDAQIVRVRPKVNPSISVNKEEDRPDPSSVLWGTRVYCHESGVEYYAAGASAETGGPTRWSELTQVQTVKKDNAGAYLWEGARLEREGKKRRVYGRVKRANGSEFDTTSNGFPVWYLSEKDRPASSSGLFGIAVGGGDTNPAFAKLTMRFETNAIVLYPQSRSRFFDLNGFEWTVD